MRVPSVFFLAVVVVACGGGMTPVSPEAASATASLGSSSSSHEEASGVEVKLRFDEIKQAGDLELRWLDINDSRCPIGVTCIWEGQVVVRLEVRRAPDETPIELELVLRAGLAAEPGKAFGVEVFLRDVEPHPKEGVTPARGDYVATLEIVGP